MESQTFKLARQDGIDAFVYRWLPPGPCKGAMQIAHGLAEHAGRYARLAKALNSAGYAVYANDHRGHGQTCQSEDQLGFLGQKNGWRLAMDDLWAVNRRIAAEQPGKPIFLLGHSMGATMAQQFIGEHGHSLAGVVFSAPNGAPTPLAAVGRFILRLERLRLGPMGRSRLANSLTFAAFNQRFAPTRTDFDWLSRDAAEVDKYVADPLCGFPATVQLWIDLLNAWIAASRPAYCNRIPKALPIYVIAGSREPVSNNTGQIQPMLVAYRAAGIRNVQHRFYPEARHELFNETCRDEVTRDLVEWMGKISN